jgi:acyl-CoA thioester hydrolase
MKKSDSGSTADMHSWGSVSRLRVRYGETDAMGWVYYANYYLFFEVARSDLIRKLWKSYRQMEDEGLKLPVTESYCKYLKGARYDDEIDVYCRISFPSPFRMRFDYEIKSIDEATLVIGYTQHCFVDELGRPIKIPDELYSTLSGA